MSETIPLSLMNTFIFCPRRFYYEYVEGEMRINEHVEEGQIKHARADTEMQGRQERDKQVSRRQYLASESLGVSGFVDLLEEKDGDLYPVEYKKGRTGNWLNDQVQLCLQGMLLEEATGRAIPYGYLYYIASNRRRKIPFDEALRQTSLDAVRQAREMSEMSNPPLPVHDNRCNGCSLQPLCLPEEVTYLRQGDGPPKQLRPPLGIDEVLYVDTPGAQLKKQGERILITLENETVRDIPMIHVGQVVVCGGVSLTTPAMHWLMRERVPVVFLSQYGRYIGSLTPEVSKNVPLRVAQHRASQDEALALGLAQGFVRGKLTNMRALLRRRYRESKEAALGQAIEQIGSMARKVPGTRNLGELLGIEGNASASYFEAFPHLLKPSTGFTFDKRTRRPPKDPTNALLSFAYSLLTADVMSAAQSVGLDPYIGFYHQMVHGRPCLALDLMEEFRATIADTVVLRLINYRQIKPDDFTESNGGWFLTDAARKRFYAAYEQRKNEEVTHPTFKYKLSYRRALELQARILAKVIMGEIPEYAPMMVR